MKELKEIITTDTNPTEEEWECDECKVPGPELAVCEDYEAKSIHLEEELAETREKLARAMDVIKCLLNKYIG